MWPVNEHNKGKCVFSGTEEGGLLPFLKKHPALGVTRQYVYVKGELHGKICRLRYLFYQGNCLCK